MDDADTADEPIDDAADAAESRDRAGAERSALAEVERILLDVGPSDLEAVAEAFVERAPGLAEELLAGRPAEDLPAVLTGLAQRADEIWRLPDGRLAPVLHHLRRATFTHRLTAGELERQAVDLLPDLVALALPGRLTLADGTEVTTAGPEDRRAADGGSLLGPDGWLGSWRAGDLVAVRYDGDRARVDPIADDALDEAAGRAVAASLQDAFAALAGPRAPEAHRLVVDTIGLDPSAFAVAVAPLVELLPLAGLRLRGAWVGPATTPWMTPLEQARRSRLEAMLGQAPPPWSRTATRVLEAWEAWMEAGDELGEESPEALTALVEDLDRGPVAIALAEVATIGRALPSVRRLGGWAAELASRTGAATASLAYLQARGADAAGDGLAAEAHLRAGLERAPDHPALLAMLAELVEDRGDAPGSMALRRRTGEEPTAASVADLAPFLADRSVGRNQPCPCGSGRKYKACCAGRSIRRPLLDRCRWLLSKAIRHAATTEPAAATSLQQLFDPSMVGDQSGLVDDALLFAAGGLARYLDTRGPLLPADELSTALTWLAQPMRLLEVGAPPAEGGTAGSDAPPTEVVDQRGERLAIAGWGAGPEGAAGPGQAVLARPLPVDDVWLLSGAVVVVPPNARAQALELTEGEVRPIQLLQLLIDLQVDALRGQLPALARRAAAGGGSTPAPRS